MAQLFFIWLYFEEPVTFWQYRQQLTAALYSFFSISPLSRTLLDPWRHDVVDASRLALRERFQALVNNLISRLIGFTLRFWVIMIGFWSILTLTIGTLVFILAWYCLPLLIIVSIGYGFKLLVGI